MSGFLGHLRQPTWVINPGGSVGIYAAGDNRNTGLDAAHPLRDVEELRRRWGRAAVIRQATTVTLAQSLASGDYLNLHAVIGNTGKLTIVGDRGTALATGTFSAKTDYANGVTAQEVTATGLGSFVDKQIEITSSGTPAHVGAVAEIAAALTADNVRTSIFGIPNTNGAATAPAGVLPSVGDTYAVYDRPIAAAGDLFFEAGSNVVSSGLSGFGHVVVQNIYLKGTTPGSGSIASSNTYLFFNGCWIELTRVYAQQLFLEHGRVSGGYFSNGSSVMYGPLFKDTTRQTAIIKGHYADVHDSLAQGRALPFCYGDGSLLLDRACCYDSTASPPGVGEGVFIFQGKGIVDFEGSVWGSNNATYGVRLSRGEHFVVAASATPSITGTLGDIGVSSLSDNTILVRSWAEGPFMLTDGTGWIKKGT